MNTHTLKSTLMVLRQRPSQVVFCISLLLSLLALLTTQLNRDGMLYVTAAEAFIDEGYAGARAIFPWPFMPMIMGITAKLTGLSPEHAARTLNALFMAGASALLVDSARRLHKESVWWVALVLLAIPGINEYRNELLREFGYWFFVLLSFWLALKWDEHPSWIGYLTVVSALACAALFRPEAVVLYAALLGWQATSTIGGERRRRMVMLIAPAAAAGILLLAFFFSGLLGERLTGELNRLSFARFDAKSQIVAQALIEYARHNAGTILFLGSLALVPLKIIQKLGPFNIPLAYLILTYARSAPRPSFGLFSWGWIITLLILGVFVTDLHFLAGRYVGLTLFFLTPMVGFCLWRMISDHPRLKTPTLVCAGFLMLANVISLHDTKSHYREAGSWLKADATPSDRVYIDSGRTAFYAGWRKIDLAPRHDQAALESALKKRSYSLYVLELKSKETVLDQTIDKLPLRIIKEFRSPNGDRVIIATPDTSAAP